MAEFIGNNKWPDLKHHQHLARRGSAPPDCGQSLTALQIALPLGSSARFVSPAPGTETVVVAQCSVAAPLGVEAPVPPPAIAPHPVSAATDSATAPSTSIGARIPSSATDLNRAIGLQFLDTSSSTGSGAIPSTAPPLDPPDGPSPGLHIGPNPTATVGTS